MTYKIKNWANLYENNRSREVKKLSWVPIPNDHSSDEYTLMVSQKNGFALLGAWISIVFLASKCEPRGILVRCNGIPHDFDSISRITRIPVDLVQETIDFAMNITKTMVFVESSDTPHGDEKEVYRQFKHLLLYGNEFKELREKYTKNEIDEALDDIENYKGNDNYFSLFLSVKHKLKENKRKEIERSKHTSNKRKPGEFKL